MHKVYVTRRIPERGLEILRPYCEITQWCSDEPVSQKELLERVKGVDGLFCLLTDRISEEVLEAAGKYLTGLWANLSLHLYLFYRPRSLKTRILYICVVFTFR